jgi:hypothetical protein
LLDESYFYPNEPEIINKINLILLEMRGIIKNIKYTWSELARERMDKFTPKDSYESHLINLLNKMGHSVAHPQNTTSITAMIYFNAENKRNYNPKKETTIQEDMDECFKKMKSTYYP